MTVNGDTWGPLRLRALPPAEPFPVDVFPDQVAGFVETAARAIGGPPDFIGLPVLVASGAAIGRSVALRLKPRYLASAALYGLNVGGPHSRKSPSLDVVVEPLWR